MNKTIQKILEKQYDLIEENYTPKKLYLNEKIYLNILKENNWIKEYENNYIWDNPKLVEKNEGKDMLNGMELIIDNDGPEWAIIGEYNE